MDITMCKNHQCQYNKMCFRYLAKPNKDRQSYSQFVPRENGTCKGMWMVCSKEELEILNKEFSDYGY